MTDAVEVLIVGAGPAGATAALNLAPTRTVAIIDITAEPRRRIGESLIPAGRRLLDQMGLLETFNAQLHPPSFAVCSVWGGPHPVDVDTIRDPLGTAWHLDRQAFDRLLRDEATRRGAELIVPAKVTAIERRGPSWKVQLTDPDTLESLTVVARTVIDATGRRASIARRLGATRVTSDRLIARSVVGRDAAAAQPGVSHIVADPDGWWYSAVLPSSERVLAFHVDADLPAAQRDRNAHDLLARARAQPVLHDLLAGFRLPSGSTLSSTAAAGVRLDRTAGDGWVAAGDAAMAFDPVSSQGVYNALFTGLAAAVTIDRQLGGDPEAPPDYRRVLTSIWDDYERHRDLCYASEQRWTANPFWARRHQQPC